MAPNVKVFENESVVSGKLCEFIAEVSRGAIAERGIFTIGLSGLYTY